MEQILKKSGPETVLQLYIKLYCKRRKSSRNTMMEAVKSWVSLSKDEKEHFAEKYKECQLNHKKKLAGYLSTKTQPFLKRKDHRRILAKQNETKQKSNLENDEIAEVESNDDQTGKQNTSQSMDIENPIVNSNTKFPNEIDLHEKTQCDLNEPRNSPNDTNFATEQQLDEPPNSPIDTSFTTEQQSTGILVEPSAPTILTAKDLFISIQSSKGLPVDTWSSLNNTQKGRYRRAVNLLKEDYIKKFKAYLESLPPKQLFTYYNDYIL